MDAKDCWGKEWEKEKEKHYLFPLHHPSVIPFDTVSEKQQYRQSNEIHFS